MQKRLLNQLKEFYRGQKLLALTLEGSVDKKFSNQNGKSQISKFQNMLSIKIYSASIEAHQY